MKKTIVILGFIGIGLIPYSCNDVDEDICECYTTIDSNEYRQLLKEKDGDCNKAFTYYLSNSKGLDTTNITIYCKKRLTKE